MFYVISGAMIPQYPFHAFELRLFCSTFMGIWLILFSYLKLLNPAGFVASFQKYDLLSNVFPVWAWLFPFVEFSMGVAYLLPGSQYSVNMITLAITSLQMFQ